jgi:hypothetical protein
VSGRIGLVLVDGRVIGIPADAGRGRLLHAAANLLLARAPQPQAMTGSADETEEADRLRRAEM